MTLMIGKNSVVSMHYTLKNDDGEVMDSSDGKPPMVYLHGANNIIPGLENEMTGKTSGTSFNASISPTDAYGEVKPELVQVINKSMFQGVESIEAGMTFVAQGDGGQQQVRVTAVENEDVTIDANHPMAGLTLHFEIEIADVREATEQEIEHGHVHADGADH
jgi:FKBP-type peptidyl-prolyl cis-trans isomerase SlyD